MLRAASTSLTLGDRLTGSVRARTAWVILAAAGAFSAMCLPALLGHVYTGDDLGAYHLPAREFYADALQHGDRFDWMPQLYNGYFLTGEGQAGTYHPLHWCLYRWLPLATAFDLELLLSYPFLFAGTFLFLRRLVRRADAAACGALIFTFSGFMLLHFIQTNAVAVVAHIPWLLWAIDVAIHDPRRNRRAAAEVAIALLTASQLLLGYPQYVWFSLIAEISFAISIAGLSRKLAYPALAKCLGLMIGAVQLLPTFDALSNSTRQTAGAEFVASGSLHPLNVVQWIAPYLFTSRVVGQNTHELGLYCGAVPILLCVWLLANRQVWEGRRRLIVAALGFGGFTLVFALGEYGYLYQLQTWLPVVGRFRFPCRAIVLVQLAIAVLAAVAVSKLIRRNNDSLTTTTQPLVTNVRPLWWIVAASIFLAATAPALWPGQIAAWPLVWAGPLLLVIGATLIALVSQGTTWAFVPLVLLTVLDLGAYGLSYSVFPHHDTFAHFATPTNPPPGEPGDKIALDLMTQRETGQRIGNRILLAGWKRADGYSGLEPARRLNYRAAAALQAAGVHYVRRTETTRSIEGLAAYNDQWYSVIAPLPRAKLLTHATACDNPALALRTADLSTTAIVDSTVDLDNGTPGEANILADRPGKIEIQTRASGSQLLALTESWHAGWRATIDGTPQPVRRVNGDFFGCVVPDGEHDVRFEFDPKSLHVGKLVTLFGLAVLGIVVGARSVGSRRHSS